MLSSNFLFKLILTPLIILATTLVSRRWGERVGGLMVGLPLTSGPVSIFFALEQGTPYAAGAAKGAILGLIPVAVFCTAYIQFSRRFNWYLSSIFSIACYLVAVTSMSLLTPDLGIEVIIIPCVLGIALLLAGKVDGSSPQITTPWWDLPLRCVIATTLLILITTGASALGSKWGGLLSPFPIFTFVMATFSHSQGGPAAAWRLIRGVLTGLFSYTAFFVVVALLVEKMNLVLVYSLATATALTFSGLFLALLLQKNHSADAPLPQ